MTAFHVSGNDDQNIERLGDFFGPAQIDSMIRQAVNFCWMGLSNQRRSTEEVELQIRRMVDRALRDFREDRVAFGKSIEPPAEPS